MNTKIVLHVECFGFLEKCKIQDLPEVDITLVTMFNDLVSCQLSSEVTANDAYKVCAPSPSAISLS